MLRESISKNMASIFICFCKSLRQNIQSLDEYYQAVFLTIRFVIHFHFYVFLIEKMSEGDSDDSDLSTVHTKSRFWTNGSSSSSSSDEDSSSSNASKSFTTSSELVHCKSQPQFDRSISVASNISFKSESSQNDFGGRKQLKKFRIKLTAIDAKPFLVGIEASNIHEFIGEIRRKATEKYCGHSVSKLFLEDEDMELTEETVEFEVLSSSKTIRIQVNITKITSNQEKIISDLPGMLNDNYNCMLSFLS